MLEIRLLEARGEAKSAATRDIFSEEFLIRRPLLQALETRGPRAPVLLIDEVDRADEEFEAFLLELLSDFAVTIPEIGTVRAERPPRVILTSNRTREVHDALKRRCLYHWIDYPTAERELAILQARLPDVARRAGPRDRRLRAAAQVGRPHQGAGHCGDPGLGGRADRAGSASVWRPSRWSRRWGCCSSIRRMWRRCGAAGRERSWMRAGPSSGPAARGDGSRARSGRSAPDGSPPAKQRTRRPPAPRAGGWW